VPDSRPADQEEGAERGAHRAARAAQRRRQDRCRQPRLALLDGIEHLFRGHGYCAARPDLWVVRLENTLRQEGGIAGALHPNAQGHREIAARLADALAVKFALPRTKTAAADDEEISDWVAGGFGVGGTIAAFALAGVGFVRSQTGRRLRARRAS
jgi:hypothetical protein